MRSALTHPLSRGSYLLAGATRFAVKFALDWTIAHFGFGREWTPLDYFRWPAVGYDAFSGLIEHGRDRWFSFVLFALALPFVWVGVVLTIRRLRAAGIATSWVILFFVPWINLLLFTLLAALPDRTGSGADAASADPSTSTRRQRRLAEEEATTRRATSAVMAIATSALVTLGLVAFGATILQNYGWGLFVGAPFLLGLVATLVDGARASRPFSESVMVMFGALALTAFLLLAVAMEGMVCILLSLPIGAALAFLGVLVGRAIVESWHPRPKGRGLRTACLAPIALSPLLMVAEQASAPTPLLREVRTDVVIAASPEVVWKRVVAFPPLAEPTEWYFRLGIACPLRAEIEGAGVGAIRRCVFSTGEFIEPITTWDAPRRLRFDVTAQPPPMREWSPYSIHPPHLDGFLQSRQGEFRLVALADGRTRLEGTTWYTNRMWPAAYWSLWSDALIHRIHRRVLEHIAGLAEADDQ